MTAWLGQREIGLPCVLARTAPGGFTVRGQVGRRNAVAHCIRKYHNMRPPFGTQYQTALSDMPERLGKYGVQLDITYHLVMMSGKQQVLLYFCFSDS